VCPELTIILLVKIL